MKMIVVPDDHYHKKDNYTFFVYDIESGSLLHKSPSNPELDCIQLVGQGRPTFRPYGVTSDDDYIYIVSNKKLGKYNKTTFEYCGLVDVPLYINTHQIMKSGQDFYITHTSVDVIGIHGETNKYFNVSKLKCVDAPQHPKHAETFDTVHVNSIAEYHNKIYFCLHNWGLKESQFGYFNKNTYESQIIAAAGFSCHGLKILNNNLYAVSSGTGEVIEIELASNKINTYKVVDPNKTFLRGLDILSDKIIFIGSNRYTNQSIPLNNCFVASFDTITKDTKCLYNIYDIDIVVCTKII